MIFIIDKKHITQNMSKIRIKILNVILILDMSCRSRLATLNERLSTLERRIEYIEARVSMLHFKSNPSNAEATFFQRIRTQRFLKTI